MRFRFAILGTLIATFPALAADATAPSVTLALGARQATVTPSRQGFTHTGAGNIDVAQPTPDTLIITMTGVAVAGAHPARDSVANLTFDLTQNFDIAMEKPGLARAKVTLESRLIGLLRSHRKGNGSAEVACPAHAAVIAGPVQIVELTPRARAVSCGENLSLNDHDGPVAASVPPGSYTLNQTFTIRAVHPRNFWPCKAASAEFAPDPALDPLWISYWEPFHGAVKKDFGFQLVIKVTPDTGDATAKKRP